MHQFQGRIGREVVMTMTSDNTELITCTQGGKNIKIYDIKSGQVKHIIKTEQHKPIVAIEANQSGSVACCAAEGGPILVVSLTLRDLLYAFSETTLTEVTAIHDEKSNVDASLSVNDGLFTADATHFLFSSDRVVREGGLKRRFVFVVCWNLEEKNVQSQLVDPTALDGTYSKRTVQTFDVTMFEMSDASHVISTHKDHVIRVFDLYTGELKKRLVGHTSDCILSVYVGCPRFLSYGEEEEDNSLRVWNSETFECMASYTSDNNPQHAHLSEDGWHVIVLLKGDVTPVVMSLRGGPLEPPPGSRSFENLPAAFPGEVFGAEIDLLQDSLNGRDDDDPDTEESADDTSSDDEESKGSDDE